MRAGLQFAWADGQTIASYQISLNGDTAVELDESFTQTLSAPAGYVLGTRPTATGTILNDDTSAGAGQNVIGSPNDFDQWAQTGVTVTPNVAANPVGDKAMNVDRITDTASNNNHGLVPPAGPVGSINQGQTYSHAVDVFTETQPFLQIFLSSTGRFTINDWANFDLVAGTVSAKGSSATASVIDLGNGWRRYILTATATGSGDPVFTVRGANVATPGRNTGYVGDGKSMLIANAQIVVGTAANAFPTS
ncbi:phage head spike fiber domain-containing protein [Sphingomonas aerolata]|uniref:phage head spike fiber domain-containing protein n=1 Tax=Sphingomonas aerolata TaxID=185951 RepID=UPI003A5C576D